MATRSAEIKRDTKETQIRVKLDLDGSGDRLLFVLKPVARADVDELNLGGVLHGAKE